MVNLFDFQKEAHDKIIDRILKKVNGKDKSKKGILLVSPTGSGKTLIGSTVIDTLIKEDSSRTFLAIVPTQSLITQVYDTLNDMGIDVRVVHNTLLYNRDKVKYRTGFGGQVVLTLPETLLNVISNNSDIEFDSSFDPFMIWFDEAHKGTSEFNQFIRNHYKNSIIFGTTATPERSHNDEGEHLRDWYDEEMIHTISINELIEIKRLVRPEYYSGYPEEAHVGREILKVIEENKIDSPKIVLVVPTSGDVALEYERSMNSLGIRSKFITSGSETCDVKPQTQKEKDEYYRQLRDGELDCLITIHSLCEGWDETCVNIVALARNVSSVGLWQQIIGRGIRAHPGKDAVYVVDLKENFKNYGKVEDIRWDEIQKKTDLVKRGSRLSLDQKYGERKKYYCCDNCHHVYFLGKYSTCPKCHAHPDIEIESYVNVKDSLEEAMGIKIDNESEFKQMVQIIFNTHYSRSRKPIFAEQINQMLGYDIFMVHEKDYEILPKFEFITKIPDIDNINFRTNVRVWK